MFTAALLTIAELCKQPGCPITDEWIKKMWYSQTMKFYSATKKNESLSFAGKWMELENIILSDVSQAQKAQSCIFSLILLYFYLVYIPQYRPNANTAIFC
jgi:hypothetical protein